MEKVTVFAYERERIALCHGTRTVLLWTCELPDFACAATRHAREIAKEVLAHARREYLPVAASELEALIGAGRGFAFRAHRLSFTARLVRMGAGLCMELTLCHTAGQTAHPTQRAKSLWTADGNARCRRVPKCKEKSEK